MYRAGWVRAHRQFMQSDLWLKERFTEGQAFLDLVGLASYKAETVIKKGRKKSIKVHLERGQCPCSKTDLAKRWKWNVRTVTRFLEKIEKQGEIRTQTNNRTTIITILDYDRFQGDSEQAVERNNGDAPLSFQDYKRECDVDKETAAAIELFLASYEQRRGAGHPNLKPAQWKQHVDTFMQVDAAGGDITLEDHRQMIPKYFKTNFDAECDYRISHYNSPGVKERRFLETCH